MRGSAARLALALVLVLTAWPAARPTLAQDEPSPAPRLVWRNVLEEPELVALPPDPVRRKGGLDVVRLEPGAEIAVLLGDEGQLRLQSPDGALTTADLAVGVSDGNGLVLVLDPAMTEGGGLLVDPPVESMSLVRIGRPASAAAPVDLAVHRADLERPPDVFREADRLDLPLPDVMLPMVGIARGVREGAGPGPDAEVAYDLVRPEEPARLRLEGPVRLSVASRPLFDVPPSEWYRAYRLEVGLDGRPWRVLGQESAPDLRLAGLVPSLALPPGREVTAELDLPAGAREVTLRPSQPVLLRVVRDERAGYLLPALNAPVLPPRTEEPGGGRWGLSPWRPDPGLLQQVLEAGGDAYPRLDRTSLEALARGLAWDNRSEPGGLAAAALLDQAAARRAGAEGLEAAADRFRGAYTFYRDLVPDRVPAGAEQRMASLRAAALRDPREPLTPAAAPMELADLLAGQLPSAILLPAPPASDPYVYRVPPRAAPGRLRVIVDGSHLEGPAELFVQVGDGRPRRLFVGAEAGLPEGFRGPNAGELGLGLLLRRHAGQLTLPTLAAPFGTPHAAGPAVPAATLDLPLPAAASTVRVWRAAGTPRAAEGSEGSPAPLRVGLQYRAARPFRLTDVEYLGEVAALGQAASLELFRAALAAALACERWAAAPDACPPAGRDLERLELPAQALVNDWAPLLRLLRARRQEYLGTIETGERFRPPPAAKDAAGSAARLVRRAETLAGEEDWLGALEAWGEVADAAGGAAWYRAQLGRAEALVRLGEGFLGTRLLKAVFLAAGDDAVRREAFERLLRLHLDEADRDAAVGLLASEVLARPGADPALVGRLAAALVAAGQDAEAVRVAILVPPEWWPVEAGLAAVRLGWSGVLDELVEAEPDAGHRRFWRGLAAQARGAYDEALTALADAGELGRPWAASLRDGLELRQALQATGSNPDALGRWLSWWLEQPGPRRWETAEHLVSGHAGAVHVESRARDLSMRTYRAEPGRPVRLNALGPTWLALELRPLHPGPDSGAPVDGWVRARVGGRTRPVPITGNFPSPGLVAVGAAGSPGTAEVETVEVPPGIHEVVLEPLDGPVLVRVAERRPVLPLSVLPAPAAAAALGVGGADLGRLGEALAMAAARARDPTVDRASEVRRQLAELLYRFETEPARRQETLARAARIAGENPTVPGVASLWAPFARQSRWDRLSSLDRSAGFRTVPVAGWQPSSPALRVRAGLLPRLGPDERLLQGAGETELSLVNIEPTTIEARLALAELPTFPEQPVTVRYRLDEEQARTVRLTPEAPARTLSIAVPQGAHVLRFALVEPEVNRFVRLRLRERGTGSVAAPAGTETETRFDVATRDEPIVVSVNGPTWLRIDRLRGGDGVVSRYGFVDSGGRGGFEEVVLRPPGGEREALYRIYRLAPEPGTPAEVRPRRLVAAAEPVPPLPIAVPDVGDGETGGSGVLAAGGLAGPLAGEDGGTWSLAALVERRTPTSVDPAERGDPDTFVEGALTYRRANPSRTLFLRSDLLARARLDGGPTVGLGQRIEYWLPERSLGLVFDADAYGQAIEGEGLEGAVEIEARGVWRDEITDRLSQSASVSLFGRHLTLSDEEAAGLEVVDQDVFTRYKDDHRLGLRLGYAARYTPWLDTRWLAEVSLTTNEDLNPTGPDHVALELGWEQLLGDFAVGAEYRHTRYLADRDRSEARATNAVNLTASWEQRLGDPAQRLDWGAALGYRFESGDIVGALSVTRHFDPRGDYGDFAPGAVEFVDIRRRRAFSPRTTDEARGVDRD